MFCALLMEHSGESGVSPERYRHCDIKSGNLHRMIHGKRSICDNGHSSKNGLRQNSRSLSF